MTHNEDYSTINYNRAGVPLLELVTEPTFHSADETIAFLETMRSIYQYAGISEADARKGQIRCDVNISIMDENSDENNSENWGTKVEIKNVNSFSSVRDAINYEINRQIELKENGTYDEMQQQTRRWSEELGEAIFMRDKVDAIDYKYFVEPNIPRFKLDPKWLEEIRASIPELPYERKAKYMETYGLSDYDAGILIKDINTAKYFEKLLELGIDAKNAANWINGNVLGYTYKYEINIQDLFMTPERLAAILKAMTEGQISSKQAKELFFMVLEREQEPADIMKAEGMQQISDDSALVAVITEVLDENTNQIEEYKNGKTNTFDYFVGQTMKKTRGQANPVKVKEILTNELANR